MAVKRGAGAQAGNEKQSRRDEGPGKDPKGTSVTHSDTLRTEHHQLPEKIPKPNELKLYPIAIVHLITNEMDIFLRNQSMGKTNKEGIESNKAIPLFIGV